MTLSVILATFRRPEPAASVVAGVLAQLPPDGEILVLDQSPVELADHLRAALPTDPRVRWLPTGPPSLPRARNVGLRAARGDVVWFLDDDVVLHSGSLDAHVGAYTDPVVGGVAGRIVELRLRPNATRLRNDVGWDGRIHTCLGGERDGWVSTAKGANMSFRRAPLLAVGGFDPAYGGTALLEDADASTRLVAAGWRLRFVARAAVDHDHLPDGGVRHPSDEAVRWRFRNTGRFLRRHRGWLGVGLAAPAFAAIAAREAARRRDPAVAGRLARELAAGAWAAVP